MLRLGRLFVHLSAAAPSRVAVVEPALRTTFSRSSSSNNHSRYISNNMSEAAAAASAAITAGGPTIFDKIIDKSIPADIVHEDELCLAFRDTKPQAPCTFWSFRRYAMASIIAEGARRLGALLGHLLLTARAVAAAENLEKGFRTSLTTAWRVASRYTTRMRILGGRQMTATGLERTCCLSVGELVPTLPLGKDLAAYI